MIEVEVKLPAADLDLIKEKLLKTGFKETAVIEERDTYIENILNSLGYQISDTVRTSYLSMLQNRKKDRHGTQC